MNPLRTAAYIALTLVFLVNSYLQLFEYTAYMNFMEQYMSFDHHVSYPIILLLRINALFFLAYYMLRVHFGMEWVPESRTGKTVFGTVILLILLNFLRSYFPVVNAWFVEDGFFENMTVVCSLVTTILCLMSVKHFADSAAKSVVVILAGAYFFLAMEEISWGQRLFRWEASEAWNAVNTQNETNVHNLIEIPFLNNVFSLVLAVMLWFLKTQVKTLEQIFPKNSLHQMGIQRITHAPIVLFIFLGIVGNGELTEEVMSVLGLYMALGFQKNPASGSRVSVS